MGLCQGYCKGMLYTVKTRDEMTRKRGLADDEKKRERGQSTPALIIVLDLY